MYKTCRDKIQVLQHSDSWAEKETISCCGVSMRITFLDASVNINLFNKWKLGILAKT
jgi:hypothetical protein